MTFIFYVIYNYVIAFVTFPDFYVFLRVQLKKTYKSSHFRVTHQAKANRWSLSTHMVSVVVRFCFCDGRTDTLCENNDHLFGRGLGGSKYLYLSCSSRILMR